MNFTVCIAGKELNAVKGENTISVSGMEILSGNVFADKSIELILKGKRHRAYFQRKDASSGEVYIDNRVIPVRIESETVRRAREILGVRTGAAGNSVAQVMSPMPGLITKILVQENATVAIGDRLCVLEAMKMENELRATVNGTITRIYVKERDTVEKGKSLIEIKLT